jgi:hypothetical protein
VHVLEALQNSAFAQWVLVSEWGYPILLTLHSLGLAMLVGVLVVMDLRVLGIPRSLPVWPMNKLMWLVWGAFAVNAASGTALFVADAVKFLQSPAFLLKLASVAIGVTLAAILSSRVFNAADDVDRERVMPVAAKVMAMCSILVWVVAIGFGRYMAYE